MEKFPLDFNIDRISGTPGRYDKHIQRMLSDMRGQFVDQDAYQKMMAEGDRILYEVYEIGRPGIAGELMQGISIIHAGKVGDEYFMTKGHFHSRLEMAEVYYCLMGQGMVIMETPEGGQSSRELGPDSVVYIPPRWAHRSVNTGQQDLIFFFVYPSDAGHNYGTIEEYGFGKLVVERDHRPAIIDNPRWVPPEAR